VKNRTLKLLIILFILFALKSNISAQQKIYPYEGFTTFTSSFIPEAICTDNAGNVIVSSVDPDNVFQDLLTKFSSKASILKRINLPETGRMKYDNIMKKIWMLIDKQFYLLDPADFSLSLFFDITDLSINTDQIYDISIELPFPSFLDPKNAIYCDFDFLYRGDQIDLFAAGFYQAWHFILRIRLNNQAVESAAVIVTSGATLSPHDNSPHGIAVNSQGIVLTTLGWPGEIAHSDQPVYFGIDYPEDQSQPPVYLFDAYQSFSSRGMTTDEHGNFYVASGWGGGGGAAGGSSCLIFVPASLDTVFTFSFQSLYANPRDVTLDEENGFMYITDSDMDFFSNEDAIWVMPVITVNVLEENTAALSYELLQNYPNPFNPGTTIRWQSAVSSKQTIKIFDLLGREIATLVDEEKPAGTYEVTWNAANLPSGIYFYKLKAGGYTATKKLMLLK
jgi:hypothetical protein